MKQLKFEQKLVEPILSGKKTATWRLYDDKDLTIGDELSLVNRDTGDEFARGRITDVQETTLGEIDLSNTGGHETYESREAMYEIFRGYYGEQVGAETGVKIVSFELFDESIS